jgi:hypothetical protein
LLRKHPWAPWRTWDRPGPWWTVTTVSSRVMLSKDVYHLPDWAQVAVPEHARGMQAVFGVKARSIVPMLLGDECIGCSGIPPEHPGCSAKVR